MLSNEKKGNLSYSGLILAHCPLCGEITNFGSREEVKEFTCRHCKSKVSLANPPRGVIATCECGQRIKAVTNHTEDMFEFDCKCGYPLAVSYSKKKNKYYGIK